MRTLTGMKWLLCGVLFTFAIACSYTLKIKDGRTAYDRKQYALAIPMLEKEFGTEKTRRANSDLAFKLAESYSHTGKYGLAVDWYKKAYDYGYGYDALKYHALALKKLERYAEARDVFKTLGKEIGSPYEFKKDISACTFAEGWLKEAPENGYKITAADFNSAQNDFAPLSFPDGRIVFSSDRAMSQGKADYNWTGNKFMDIFIVEADGASPQLFDNTLNTPGNEGTPCFNKAGTAMYFVRALGAYKGDDAYCKIYFSQRQTDEEPWSTPTPLPFQKEKINYLHPALSSDGATLYFSCNDPEGWGGYDLYAINQNANNDTGWDEPKLLSRGINSTGNELFPSFDADTLYFASDGLTGMGGLDIFRTYKSERNAWFPPINLKAPINSGMDDFSFVVTQKTNAKSPTKTGDLLRSGFFSSNRPGGSGGDDIYRFEQRVPAPKPVKKDTSTASKLVYKMVLEGYVLEKILEDASNPNSKLLGRKPLGGAVVKMDVGGKKQSITLKEDGFFRLDLNENTDYKFQASMDGFLANSAKFSTKGIAKDPANPVQTFEIEIVLDKIFKNREIVLENIYYDYDKWDIRPDAEPTLNRLAEVLQQNPAIRIQLGSHTDCRGNEGYNQLLSQRRAESAVNYLISKGISSERLSALGYGETQPVASCACNKCTESEHQTNRRTTFKISEF